MAAEFVSREDLESASDKLTTYVDIAVQKHIRESERRIRAEMQSVRDDLKDFRERHDVELAQVHAELGRINDILMWIAQRLPPDPMGPPPAQFVRQEDEQK